MRVSEEAGEAESAAVAREARAASGPAAAAAGPRNRGEELRRTRSARIGNTVAPAGTAAGSSRSTGAAVAATAAGSGASPGPLRSPVGPKCVAPAAGLARPPGSRVTCATAQCLQQREKL